MGVIKHILCILLIFIAILMIVGAVRIVKKTYLKNVSTCGFVCCRPIMAE